MSPLLNGALGAEHLILSSAGPHAGQAWRQIVARKSSDVDRAGHSVWVLNSNAARPEMVQTFCEKQGARYVIFVTRERGKGSRGTAAPDVAGKPGTTRDQRARHYSADRGSWASLDPLLTEVTGDIRRSTTGLWFDCLEETPSGSLDLGSFVKHHDGEVLTRFWPSDSAYLVRRRSDIRSGQYRILAVGKLAPPFAVWLQS